MFNATEMVYSAGRRIAMKYLLVVLIVATTIVVGCDETLLGSPSDVERSPINATISFEAWSFHGFYRPVTNLRMVCEDGDHYSCIIRGRTVTYADDITLVITDIDGSVEAHAFIPDGYRIGDGGKCVWLDADIEGDIYVSDDGSGPVIHFDKITLNDGSGQCWMRLWNGEIRI